MQNEALWTRIAAHPMPADSAGLSFREQLMRDQKISGRTADRGILEYRRFLYLCATGQSRCVPTKAVDAVWHLHLGHTRDYWDRFVPDVLDGRAIHHTPGETPGHADDFAATLRRYAAEFGEVPPKGIWYRESRDTAVTGMLAGLTFAGLFALFSQAEGLPLQLEALLLILAALMFYFMTLAPLLCLFGISAGIQADVWADGEGGDCGDCGGGCGD